VTRLEELTRKVDAFFARVALRHGDDMQCASGCSDCCRVRLTITGVEAAAIRAHVTTWPAEQRRALAVTGPDDRCAALDAAGRCRIYPVRPLVCRSHGVPIRLRRGGLPVVEACPRNFTHTTPDPDCVLDQATLSAVLLAVDLAGTPGEVPAAPPPTAAAPRAGEPAAPALTATAAAPSEADPAAPALTATATAPRAGEPAVPAPAATAAASSGAQRGARIDLAGLLAELAAI